MDYVDLQYVQKEQKGYLVMADEFDFWNDHSREYLSMAYMWDRRQELDNPDGSGKKTGDCGDTITMYLKVDNGVVEQLCFELDGCINTSACCNVVASMVENQPVAAGWDITPAEVIEYLGTLPEDHHHCAELAVGTFYLCLADYEKRVSPSDPGEGKESRDKNLGTD
ncbi:MAG: nitrogen fixation NifU-like protein [Desulforhopalus sp.]|jgi:nitrogen fixation NifU-like protein